MEPFKYTACALPACSCPVLEVENDVDGNSIVYITDDYGHVVQMTPAQMGLIAMNFLMKRSEEVIEDGD